MFNKAQKEAVHHVHGPMLITAGPGSGKTRVITYRTKYLIEEAGVPPENILVITFTKASATEMKERFLKIMDLSYTPVTFGTFHAVFFNILRNAYHYTADNIIRDDKRQSLFREIISSMDMDIEDESDFIRDIASEISLVKGEMLNLDCYYAVNCSEEIFKEIYCEYDKKLRNCKLIDFEDMLVLCYDLLQKRSDILAGWQKKFQYILVDEFQDINATQYKIVKMLAEPKQNLFIVGDDDQSIYRFRGARPEIMLHFREDYPDSKMVLLSTNYRCAANIVEMAGRVIQHNTKRFSKEILSFNPKTTDVDIQSFDGLISENQAIVDKIIYYRNTAGISLSDIAVIFRTNTGPRLLVEKLMEYNISFHMRDRLPNLYEHWIARDIIAYMKMAMGTGERSDLLRIANKPKRYISRMSIETNFNQMKSYYNQKPWMLERISEFEYQLGMIGRMSPYAAINYIRKGIDYESYLKEYAEYRRMKEEELYEILEEIHLTSKEYETMPEWLTHIEEYTAELKKQSSRLPDKTMEGVTMTTMHSAKGLEYRVVFVIDVNEKIIPHHKAILEEDIEEERRLFYVALTRAKEYLHVYSAKERYEKEMEVSRFVGEMLIDAADFKVNASVVHVALGEGVIQKVMHGKSVIYFHRIRASKTFDINFCIRNQMIQFNKGEGEKS